MMMHERHVGTARGVFWSTLQVYKHLVVQLWVVALYPKQ